MKAPLSFVIGLLSLSLFAAPEAWRNGERVPLWPEGKIPDFQAHQVGAMTDEQEKGKMPYLEWFAAPTNANGGCMILISWIGAHAIVASGGDPAIGLSTGNLMSLISYSMQILMSIMMLSFVFVMTTIARESADRVCEVLREKSDLANGENPVMEVPDGSVSFENVSFAYSKTSDKLCLDNININIASGETVGIIGGTGSSKSTFVQMIPRLYDVTEGSVKVGGIDVRDYDLKTLRDSVAMVLQKNVLFSGTIKEPFVISS